MNNGLKILLRPRAEGGVKKIKSRKKKVKPANVIRLSFKYDDLKLGKKARFMPELGKMISKETKLFYGVDLVLDYSDAQTKTAVAPLIGDSQTCELPEVCNKDFCDSFYEYIQEKLVSRGGAVVSVNCDDGSEDFSFPKLIKTSERSSKNHGQYKFALVMLMKELTRIYFSKFCGSSKGSPFFEYVQTVKRIVTEQKDAQGRLETLGIGNLHSQMPNATVEEIDTTLLEMRNKMDQFLRKHKKDKVINIVDDDNSLLGKRKRNSGNGIEIENMNPMLYDSKLQLKDKKRMMMTEKSNNGGVSSYDFSKLEVCGDRDGIIGEIGSMFFECKNKKETANLLTSIHNKILETEEDYEKTKKRRNVYSEVKDFLTEEKCKSLLERFEKEEINKEVSRRKKGLEFLNSLKLN